METATGGRAISPTPIADVSCDGEMQLVVSNFVSPVQVSNLTKYVVWQIVYAFLLLLQNCNNTDVRDECAKCSLLSWEQKSCENENECKTFNVYCHFTPGSSTS